MKVYYNSVVKKCPDSDDYYIELDPNLVQQLDWREGDDLSFKVLSGVVEVRNLTLEIRVRNQGRS